MLPGSLSAAVQSWDSNPRLAPFVVACSTPGWFGEVFMPVSIVLVPAPSEEPQACGFGPAKGMGLMTNSHKPRATQAGLPNAGAEL